MNIFGRSQEQQSLDTATISVSATPTLTRVIQNAYNSTALRSAMTGTSFTTLDTAGTGSKTISNLGVGQSAIVSFSGCLTMAANPVGNGSFQFQFYFDDGTYAYSLDTEITDYFPAFTNEEYDCYWIVQKTTTTQVLLSWQISAPSNDISGQTVKKTGRIETYPTNRVSVTCASGADISLNVYYKSRNADKPISFNPSFFKIDVMRDITLTADYI